MPFKFMPTIPEQQTSEREKQAILIDLNRLWGCKRSPYGGKILHSVETGGVLPGYLDKRRKAWFDTVFNKFDNIARLMIENNEDYKTFRNSYEDLRKQIVSSSMIEDWMIDQTDDLIKQVILKLEGK